jgi:hypothetical protein
VLLFGLFIFEYDKLGLLDKDVHKLFEGVHNFFLVENIYIKKKFSFVFLKSQHTLAPT